jgi:hypothetical protein
MLVRKCKKNFEHGTHTMSFWHRTIYSRNLPVMVYYCGPKLKTNLCNLFQLYLLVLVHVNMIEISNKFLSFFGAKLLWYEMMASTDYVPLLLNYFPLFCMVGDDLTCNGITLLFRFFCPSTGRHPHESPGYLTQLTAHIPDCPAHGGCWHRVKSVSY